MVHELRNLVTGTYTLTAQAVYDTDGLLVTVSSQPSTFKVAMFLVKTQSWSPNPAAVSQVITGQAQAKFDPSSLDGMGSGPFFVTYTWTTAGVWYSQDGTPGTFEPLGSYAIGWTQGQASTTFSAQFFTWVRLSGGFDKLAWLFAAPDSSASQLNAARSRPQDSLTKSPAPLIMYEISDLAVILPAHLERA